MDKKKLLRQIEKVRKEMYKLMEQQKEVNDEIVKKSQELDKLLNKYQDILDNE